MSCRHVLRGLLPNGDPTIRSFEQTLKDQGFYYGAVTGEKTPRRTRESRFTATVIQRTKSAVGNQSLMCGELLSISTDSREPPCSGHYSNRLL